MPPGAPLSEAEIEVLRLWIDEGAIWPNLRSGLPGRDAPSEEPRWWSLRPVGLAKLPDVGNVS